MFHLRRHWGSLVASASRRLRQVCASFATGPRQYDRTFYEFRTYIIQPEKMNKFLENTNKYIHLRTAHSELIGYWKQEFGGVMNKVFHIWKYDDFAHRAKVRKALAQDKEWQEKYISPNLPFMVQQKNEITYLVPWCKIEKPPKEGFYELVTFQMKPGGPALWGEHFQKAVNIHVQVGYSKLIGVFHTEYGTLNRVHVLWWIETPDIRAAGRHRSHEDARVVAAGELGEWVLVQHELLWAQNILSKKVCVALN
ncbi:protein NipSnap homolog 3A isoform X2 [Petaurus breviceps papuanus]|uniref:protein NipSnap homolog 3A isoform X2 n=1 Tax=Petaurus breviceps papuanus TaxID=3040969 RepID=UPI0036DC60AD